ncbi:hypothetical protein E3N88_17836 [Mikania micrantha]|uniref:Endonuclease/exonuclease/phosphatase domain-containing protein n=1 Tax=Mikania micrantha TaxID=192012 RepID=A0A5N6NUE7_9ASTR|nr:hypothetical protein E3N88_17836 [Mikania micrantha]
MLLELPANLVVMLLISDEETTVMNIENLLETTNSETQFLDIPKIKVGLFWGNSAYDVAAVEASGRSGGLMCIWDPTVFQKNRVVARQNYILISGVVRGQTELFNVVNVYGPHELNKKKVLWEELEHMKSSGSGIWMFAGDFNEVREPADRVNSEFCSQGANLFNQFIFNAQLVEFHMGGHPYTYMRGYGAMYIKLDRFLVCDGFVNHWPNACVTALPRHLSDHCPIVLISSNVDFGPSPFRFFSSWLQLQGIDGVVGATLGTVNARGRPDRMLASKLKAVKEALKRWVADQRCNNAVKLLAFKQVQQRLEQRNCDTFFSWQWKRDVLNEVESEELDACRALLQNEKGDEFTNLPTREWGMYF